MDPLGALLTLSGRAGRVSSTFDKLRDIILSTQYASESRNALEAISKTDLPPFPQTALSKLRGLINLFPPPEPLTPVQLARLFLTIHPALIHAPFQAWAILSRQTKEAGLGELGSLSTSSIDEQFGLFGYHLASVERVDDKTARITFNAPKGLQPVSVLVPAGPKQLRPFPFSGHLEFQPTSQIHGLVDLLPAGTCP